MRPSTLALSSTLILAGLLGLALFVFPRSTIGQGQPPSRIAQPVLDPIRLLSAQPFVLDTGYVHEWRSERPTVSAGYVLVLGCDPELVEPRATAEPVLYVGEETAERINAATPLGNLVVVVPAPRDASGGVALDLSRTPIWFGAPELPERVDAARIRAELAASRAVPFAQATVANALAAGGGTLFLADRGALDLELARVVEQASPTETDLVSGLRAPRPR